MEQNISWRDNKIAFFTGLIIISVVSLLIALTAAGYFITYYMIPLTTK